MSNIVEVRNLSKSFLTKDGRVDALRDIDLSVEQGDIYGIIGMSGAGKSTLVRCLNYLEVPLVLKYRCVVAPMTAIEPFLGGYLSCGVGGQIRDFGDRAAYGSFSDNNFGRFDGGVRIGCGAAFSMLYMELGYDLGLANISKDYFDASHNGCFFMNIGLNF